MLAFTKALARGSDKAMTQEQAAKIYIPIDGFIRKIKDGKIALHEALEVYQHFLLVSAACDVALTRTKEDAKPLIRARDAKLQQALREARNIYRSLKNLDTILIMESTHTALRDGFTASVELLETLPDWCFMEAGYEMMKANRRR